MGPVCVSCHNTHPDSPKTDWKVGDVRGIQEISVVQPIAANVLSFKYLLVYFALAAMAGLTFILLQRRQSALVEGMNRELTDANDFLASISLKIAKYLSPQIYKSIFSGQKDTTIATERKKLTIFFSDIKDFTAISERLQPEDLTALLNEYFTEMSTIALKHGATVDKFIGDALLVFFGDPDTQGVEEDAKACLRMAVDMQHRLEQLNRVWSGRGIELPFQARMGINTGYCNVGNFGSEDRMDYTIIGAEANLAARLQSIARARRHLSQLRDLRAGARPRAGASAPAHRHEGHQPRGGALRGRGPAGRARAASAGHQRARHRPRPVRGRGGHRRQGRRAGEETPVGSAARADERAASLRLHRIKKAIQPPAGGCAAGAGQCGRGSAPSS